MIRPRRLLAIAFACAPIFCAPAQASPSIPGPPADADWQHYVVGPTAAIARPVRIVSISGHVDNAAALSATGTGGTATLTRSANETSPTNIVLDYGIDVGGLPVIDVASASGSPQLRASYSESLPYLTLDGDHGPSHSADPHRYDTYIVSGSGMITNAFTQGGERFQMISLTSPGTVSLRAVGVKSRSTVRTRMAIAVILFAATRCSTGSGMPALIPCRSTCLCRAQLPRRESPRAANQNHQTATRRCSP